MKLFCAVLLALCGGALSYVTYDGYQVLRTREVPEAVFPALLELTKNNDYDFWTTPRVGTRMVIMAGPEHVDILRDSLHRLRLNPEVYIPDVGVSVRRERIANDAARMNAKRTPRAASYDHYMTYDEVMTFLDEVVAGNPGLVTELNLATSTEGRRVRGVKISSGAGKKAVWQDCVIHAREWLAAPVCMKVIEDVLADPNLQSLVDWYILPIANPDGYAYSHTDERLWRKTRRPNPNPSCVGTDGNRNFPYHWNQNNNNDYCAEDYPGNRAYSEPECAGIGSVVDPLAASGDLVLYIATHSYGALLIYPWGDTASPAPNQAVMQSAGDTSAAIIRSYRGTRYTVEQSSTGLYFTYGASDDHAYANGAKMAYTFELPGGGLWGFNPPPSEIVPCVTETVPGIISLVESALANYGP